MCVNLYVLIYSCTYASMHKYICMYVLTCAYTYRSMSAWMGGELFLEAYLKMVKPTYVSVHD
jgi:hypothetical protein